MTDKPTDAKRNAIYETALRMTEADTIYHETGLGPRELLAHRDELAEALEEVKERCLFADDDGLIGVTTDPNIESELFDRICAALTRTEPKKPASPRGE